MGISFFSYSKDYIFESYEGAVESQESIRFESESTKFGIFTTSYNGYAKSYNITYKKNVNVIESINVKIVASSIDTDNDSRNEKMHNSILDVSKYPEIIFKSLESLDLSKSKHEVVGTLKVRGVEKKISLLLNTVKTEEGILIEGSTSISLKSYGIPDPSIAIASVRDRQDIKFRILISE